MHDLETWYQAKAAKTQQRTALPTTRPPDTSVLNHLGAATASRAPKTCRSSQGGAAAALRVPEISTWSRARISTSPSAPNAIILSGVEATTVHRAPVF
ncbi:hypothetical protein C6341_g12396 [Phytophthora cactorum]|nr:hypothetical protein C6341_g12396 [Phytophthora cactorum]